MKLIFLDIDGVLNSTYAKGPYESDMEVSKLLLLSKLIKESKSEGIIITSDRRLSNVDMKHKLEAFRKYDIKVVGTIRDPNIKDYEDNRGKQISDYLSSSKEDINNIVILDDIDDGISNLFPDEFIHINRVFGFNNEAYQKSLEILNKNPS